MTVTFTPTQIGITLHLHCNINTAQERVAAALKTEGFGVLTEIDVQATLKNKINVDFRPYKILGACNPALAHRALQVAPEVGLLLPCNVTLSQVEAGVVEVAIINPLMMLDMVRYEGLQPVAQEAYAKLERVAATLVNQSV